MLERHDHLVAPGHDWDNADSDSIAHLATLSADKLVLLASAIQRPGTPQDTSATEQVRADVNFGEPDR